MSKHRTSYSAGDLILFACTCIWPTILLKHVFFFYVVWLQLLCIVLHNFLTVHCRQPAIIPKMEIVVQIFQDLTELEKIKATVIFTKIRHRAIKPFCLKGTTVSFSSWILSKHGRVSSEADNVNILRGFSLRLNIDSLIRAPLSHHKVAVFHLSKTTLPLQRSHLTYISKQTNRQAGRDGGDEILNGTVRVRAADLFIHLALGCSSQVPRWEGLVGGWHARRCHHSSVNTRTVGGGGEACWAARKQMVFWVEWQTPE